MYLVKTIATWAYFCRNFTDGYIYGKKISGTSATLFVPAVNLSDGKIFTVITIVDTAALFYHCNAMKTGAFLKP